MNSAELQNENPHLAAIRQAWWEFRDAVSFEAFCLYDDDEGEGRRLWYPLAWLCAPWRPLLWRFRRDNLERLFRPLKAERRWLLNNYSDRVFWGGADDLSEDEWAEVEALIVEFGWRREDFPPRDFQAVTVTEAVGAIMGMTREEVAEVVKTVTTPVEPNLGG
jgi:hypothetical protein